MQRQFVSAERERMKNLWFALACSSVLLISACNRPQPAPPEPEYRLTATIREIMESSVEPSADFLWNSVSTISDATGTHESAPQNDEDWEHVRGSAITLLESTNLILMPGRKVAKPGEAADDPKVELHPDEIQKLIDSDQKAWTGFVHGLHDATMVALKAIDAKNTDALLDSGEGIDKACENCHLKYWYPNQANVAQ
jgi:hypothetical protein